MTATLERLQTQDFELGANDVIAVCTAGKGEDSWTPAVNGLLDMYDQMALGAFGFLQRSKANPANTTQRKGRVGRFRDGLYMVVESTLPQITDWDVPYEERLGVVLVAVDLRYGGPIPGIDSASRAVIEYDLAELALCRRVDQQSLEVTLIGEQVRLLVDQHTY